MTVEQWVLLSGGAAVIVRLVYVELKGTNRIQSFSEMDVLNKALNVELNRRELVYKDDLEREKRRCDEEMARLEERFTRRLQDLTNRHDELASEVRDGG